MVEDVDEDRRCLYVAVQKEVFWPTRTRNKLRNFTRTMCNRLLSLCFKDA